MDLSIIMNDTEIEVKELIFVVVVVDRNVHKLILPSFINSCR